MAAAAFDTLSAARDLEAAGIERTHAEAIAKAIHHGDERAATKADLKVEMDGLETRINAKLADLETRLVKWAVALAGAVVIILGVIIRWP